MELQSELITSEEKDIRISPTREDCPFPLPLPPEDTSSSQFFSPIPSYVDSPSPFRDSQSISSGYSSLKDIDQASESSSRSNKTLSFKEKTTEIRITRSL